MVFSGTAFHWISEEIGYPKVYNILKSGGTLALFWNKPGPKSFDDPLHLRMQDNVIYDFNNNIKVYDTIELYLATKP